MRYLIDTDICIAISRDKPRVRERFNALQTGDACISLITYGELLTGAVRSLQEALVRKQIQTIVDLVPVMDLHLDVANTYARLRAVLEERGRIIGTNDLWIAAHALTLNLTLVTNNEREFRRISELRIENWLTTV